MVEDVYQTKYLKYKQKYLDLKKLEKQLMKGGNNNKNELVLYKADWCGHCNRFKPAWEQLKKQNINVSFVEYDADKDRKVIEKHNINGYPTIHYKIKGGTYEYNGERTVEGLINFMKSYN
jgi:thiol-disulfide isomerase/thioredoxin